MKENELDYQVNTESPPVVDELEYDADSLPHEHYEVARAPLFKIIRMAKGEQLRTDHIDYSILTFILEGKARVSTGIYMKKCVDYGQMYVVHKGDNAYLCCLEHTVVLLCLFDSSMALCNCLSLNNTSNFPPPNAKTTHREWTAISAHC